MLKKERHNFILRYLNAHGTALVSNLSNTLKVSHDTIVRDLRELSKENLLTRVHGGALALEHHPVQKIPTPAQTIAQKAIALLHNNSFLMTCDGEALLELYSLLPPTFNGTLLTVSMQIASKYSEHPTMEVIQIGDRVQKASKMTVGSEAIAKIRQIKADMCLLTASAIDPQYGVTETDWQIAHVKMAMAESSGTTVYLIPSAALGKISPIQACRPQGISYLITELDFMDPFLDAYRAVGIKVL